MFNFAKLKSIFSGDVVWIFAAMIVVAVKLGGLFSEDILAGWDTLPHFFAFIKTIELLNHGSFSGYMPEWFEGFPLFYFYGPLTFILGWLIKTVSLGTLSNALAWRVLMYGICVSYIWAFWFFCRTFFGEKAGKPSIAFSLIFIFYPKIFAPLGIGFVSLFATGLFASYAGLSIMLTFFAVVERYRRVPSRTLFVLGTLLLCASIVNHILSTVWLLIAWGVYWLVHIRNRKFARAQVGMGLASVGLSAFFILPFATHFSFTSGGSMSTFSSRVLSLLVFPFLSLLHSNPVGQILGKIDDAVFEALALCISAFLLWGIVSLEKKKEDKTGNERMVLYWLVVFLGVCIAGGTLAVSATSLPIHYYRSAPVLLTFILGIGVYGFAEALTHARRALRIVGIVAAGGLMGFLMGHIYLFTTESLSETTDAILSYARMPYHFNVSDYPDYENGMRAVREIAALNPQRVFTEGESADQFRLGSPHFFLGMLPLIAHTQVLGGLYVESAHQGDIVMSLNRAISRSLAWGTKDMVRNEDFYTRISSVNRLAEVGVDYALVHTPFAQNIFSKASSVELIKRFGTSTPFTNEYEIYKVKDFRGIIRTPTYVPGIFIDNSADREKNFKILSMNLFSYDATYAIPIAAARTVEEIPPEDLNNFSFFMLNSSDDKMPATLLYLRRHGIRQIIIAEQDDLDRFSTTPQEGQLLQKIIALKSKYPQNAVGKLVSISDGSIYFEGAPSPKGRQAWLITQSYFPNWTYKGEHIYQVTPGNMLIFSSETKNELVFKKGWLEYAGVWVSLVTGAGLVWYLLSKRRLVFRKRGI